MVRSKLVSNRVQKRLPQKNQESPGEVDQSRRTTTLSNPRPLRWYEEGVSQYDRRIELTESIGEILYSMKNEIPFSSGTYDCLVYYGDYQLETGKSNMDHIQMEGLNTFDPDDPETHIPVTIRPEERLDQVALIMWKYSIRLEGGNYCIAKCVDFRDYYDEIYSQNINRRLRHLRIIHSDDEKEESAVSTNDHTLESILPLPSNLRSDSSNIVQTMTSPSIVTSNLSNHTSNDSNVGTAPRESAASEYNDGREERELDVEPYTPPITYSPSPNESDVDVTFTGLNNGDESEEEGEVREEGGKINKLARKRVERNSKLLKQIEKLRRELYGANLKYGLVHDELTNYRRVRERETGTNSISANTISGLTSTSNRSANTNPISPESNLSRTVIDVDCTHTHEMDPSRRTPRKDTFQIMAKAQDIPTLKSLNRERIETLRAAYMPQKRLGLPLEINMFLTYECRRQMDMAFYDPAYDMENQPGWEHLEEEILFQRLLLKFPQVGNTTDPKQDCILICEKQMLVVDDDITRHSEMEYLDALLKMDDEIIAVHPERIKTSDINTILDVLLRMLVSKLDRRNAKALTDLHTKLKTFKAEGKLRSVREYCYKVKTWADERRAKLLTFQAMGFFNKNQPHTEAPTRKSTDYKESRTGRLSKGKKRHVRSTPERSQTTKSDTNKVCDGCGGNTHYRKDCKFGQSGHPEFVKTGKWSESEVSKKVDRLNWKTTSDGKPWTRTQSAQPKVSSTEPREPSKKKKRTCKCVDCMNKIEQYNTDISEIDHEHIYVMNTYNSSIVKSSPTVLATILSNHNSLTVNVLFDTGALQSNYVSERVAKWLDENGTKAVVSKARVCSALNTCVNINHEYNSIVSFLDVDKNNNIERVSENNSSEILRKLILVKGAEKRRWSNLSNRID